MPRKFFLFGRPSKSVDSGQVDLSSRHEERLNTALASLRRRAAYRRNPLKLDKVIDRVCYAAEVYRRWQESGAFIRDIVLRLSDGSEIKIDKATPQNTNLFGFQVGSKLPRGSVINVYKQADKEFPEDVLLYSIDLDSIGVGGHSYEKTYENGQRMTLKVEGGLSGQFNVSVEYTTPGEAVNVTPSRRERLFKLLPGPVELVGLGLLAVLVVLAIQKRDAIHVGTTGEGVAGAAAEVNTLETNPAAPPQTPADGQARQNSPADINVKDTYGSPGAGAGTRQPESPAHDAVGDAGLPDAATPTAAHRRKAPGVAGGGHASARKPDDVRRLQEEAARQPDGARGDFESSGSNEAENSEAENSKVTRIVVVSQPAGPSGGGGWKYIPQSIEAPVANPVRSTPAGRDGKDLRLKRHLRRTDSPAAPDGGAKSSAEASGKT
jgi:hypothetical protein